MVLPEAYIFGTIGSALIITWSQLFRMEDDKQDKLDNEISQAYKTLRDNTLDPILQQILSITKGRFRPEKLFTTPEIVEKLSTYKEKLFEFNEISAERNTVLILLSFAANTAAILGIITLALTGINQFFVNSQENITFLTTTHISILTTLILGIGLIFLGVFIYQYRSHNKSFKQEIRKIGGGIK